MPVALFTGVIFAPLVGQLALHVCIVWVAQLTFFISNVILKTLLFNAACFLNGFSNYDPKSTLEVQKNLDKYSELNFELVKTFRFS